MQKLTTSIARLWNAGCLGKIAIGFIALVVLGCIGSALGVRQTPQQNAASTTLPIVPVAAVSATDTPLPTQAPRPTTAPEPSAAPIPTNEPVPTSEPSAIPLPTEPPAAPIVQGVAPIGSACPADAPIKGNIVDRGARKGDKIYHVPGSSSYQPTKPERCFATVADAESAGYRAPAR